MYSRGSEFVTVSVPFSVLFTVPFFTTIATVTVPFFSLTVRSVKRTEPLILTVRFLVFDREPYRTKIGIVIFFLLRTANRTASKWAPLPIYIWGPRTVPHQERTVIRLYLRTANRTAPILVRYYSKYYWVVHYSIVELLYNLGIFSF